MREIFLIARRDYFAYVTAWGFWVSLITAPLLVAAIGLAPLVLSQAEPPRVLSIIADRPDDGVAAARAIEAAERNDARTAVLAYVAAAAPRALDAATQSFDAAPTLRDAVTAARTAVAQQAPGAVGAFPAPTPRYLLIDPPARTPESLTPYLNGERFVSVDGQPRPLFGALFVTREGEGAQVRYWSANLADVSAANRVVRGVGEAMRTEALAAWGLTPEEAAAIQSLRPTLEQFDPRQGAEAAAVTTADRAPLIVAVILSFVLWSAVFGVANMLLTSVLEEKSNKILDTLLTSASPLQILIGKLAGVACVSATFFFVWGGLGAGIAALANRVSHTNALAEWAAQAVMPELAAMFLACFIVGYMMYGAVFLALGSLCETNQEAQTLLGPIFLILTAPILLLGPAFDNPNSPLVAGAAWFPPFTPFLLMMRAPAGLAWYELAGPVALMLLTLALVLWGAARVFHAGVAGQADAAALRRRLNPFRKRSGSAA
jgi:ABC-2 type transport system permease protein